MASIALFPASEHYHLEMEWETPDTKLEGGLRHWRLLLIFLRSARVRSHTHSTIYACTVAVERPFVEWPCYGQEVPTKGCDLCESQHDAHKCSREIS
ncbi:hypothetical protein M514_10267 [Trichuris suis]|uniref:Uncharacterized protein n=1 Tax=Trichuris suis TaxID=68888 RepID=A0A085LVA8_9BILA|nr:hypothetical protein M513_10267 [Trichuris suis]KFD66195.1 hypothetical protein M514_10267 [Trichuris suis]